VNGKRDPGRHGQDLCRAPLGAPEILKALEMPTAQEAALMDEKTISISLGTPLETIEKRVIEETLRHSRGDKNVASKILGISARTIYRKIEEEKKEDRLDDEHSGKVVDIII
jgi:two-component system response regulator HydG